MRTQKVYLVGAGPGEPDLITVQGLNILKQADVVIYDYLVDKRLLEHVRETAQLICCNGSDRKKIMSLLIKKAKQGKKVLRLKGGDAAIFSRLSEELKALDRAGIEFEIVPGVTAASAAASLLSIPLTDRDSSSSCIFVTGRQSHKKSSLIDWQAVTKSGIAVFYMAVATLPKVIAKLRQAGKDKHTPVAIIKDASLITQKVLTGTLKDIAAKAKTNKLTPPAIMIVGETARLEKEFNWLKKNRRILFTGLSAKRFFLSGKFFHLPLIKIEPLDDYRQFDNYLKAIEQFDWIVFASRYGVEYFFRRLKEIGSDCRALKGIRIAAIGNSTRLRLLDWGILADLVPQTESAQGLIDRFKRIDIKDKKIFLPRSDISDKGLSNALKTQGAKVTTGFAYKNVMPQDLPDLDLTGFNEIIFTSPSTVRNFKQRYKRIPQNTKVSCIGQTTAREAKRCRLLD